MIDVKDAPKEESRDLPDRDRHKITEQDLRRMTSYILAGEKCTVCDNFLDGGQNCPHCGANIYW